MFTPDSVESVIGTGVVKKVFEISNSSKVAGSLIEDGKVISKAFARIIRDEKQIAEVQIQSLRRKKSSKGSLIWTGVWYNLPKIQ